MHPISFSAQLKPVQSRHHLDSKTITSFQFTGQQDDDKRKPVLKLPAWIHACLLTGAGFLGLGQIFPSTHQISNQPKEPIIDHQHYYFFDHRMRTMDGYIITMEIVRQNENITLRHFNKSGRSNQHRIHINELPLVKEALEHIYADRTWENLRDMTQADFDDALRCELISINCKKEALAYEKKQYQNP
jgi:hypothetical protein